MKRLAKVPTEDLMRELRRRLARMLLEIRDIPDAWRCWSELRDRLEKAAANTIDAFDPFGGWRRGQPKRHQEPT